MKILVVTPRFGLSGVPLAQFKLARALASEGHQVDLMIGGVETHLQAPQAPGVNTIALEVPNVRSMFFPLRRYLKREKPEVIFSAEDHLNAIVMLAAISLGSKAKISGSSRVRPFDTYSNVPFTKRWILKQIVRLVQWRADVLTCVSRDMVDQYRQVFKSPRHTAVYNIVLDTASRARMADPVDEPWLTDKSNPVIIAAGMLQPWKGFGDLIQAVASLQRRGRNVKLIILGEGPLRKELEKLALDLGVGNSVKLPGLTDNPLKYFSRADLFVLSSYVEGLPNVLVEAMICGCTPVSTDCPTGPREVLQNGRFGYLVPVGDPEALSRGIERGLDHPIPAHELALAVQPFEQGAVLSRHFELLGLAA